MIYQKDRPSMNTHRTMSIFFSLNRYDFNISIVCGLTEVAWIGFCWTLCGTLYNDLHYVKINLNINSK